MASPPTVDAIIETALDRFALTLTLMVGGLGSRS
jgi:hypothetical protein